MANRPCDSGRIATTPPTPDLAEGTPAGRAIASVELRLGWVSFES